MFTLPTLPYAYTALEPYLDAQTMELHHTKHHQTYVDKLNAALEKYPDLQTKSVEDLLLSINTVPQPIRQAVTNHGGGHHNHSLFWTSLAPRSPERSRMDEVGSTPTGSLAQTLMRDFGSVEVFKQRFTETAANHFGSGWAWLVLTQPASEPGSKAAHDPGSSSKLDIYSLPNQNSPLSQNDVPLLGLDLWEHAYYLKYQNRRPEYIEAWWNLVSWPEIEKRYQEYSNTMKY